METIEEKTATPTRPENARRRAGDKTTRGRDHFGGFGY